MHYLPEPSGMDSDYLAFRELLKLPERDPAIAAELTRLMDAGAPLGELLALAGTGASGESGDFGGIRFAMRELPAVAAGIPGWQTQLVGV